MGMAAFPGLVVLVVGMNDLIDLVALDLGLEAPVGLLALKQSSTDVIALVGFAYDLDLTIFAICASLILSSVQKFSSCALGFSCP